MFRFVLSHFSPDIWVFAFFGIFDLKGSHISSENNEKQKKKLERLDRGTLNSCA